jgi:hypothetical protein
VAIARPVTPDVSSRMEASFQAARPPSPAAASQPWCAPDDGSYVRGVSAEALCACFHKPFPRKHAHMR